MIEDLFTPIEKWGKDHKSTMLYLETRVVDHGGYPDDRQMRSKDPNYPTRLNDGTTIQMHSDYDCVDDMIAAGLVKHEPIPEDAPQKYFYRYSLTDAGWAYAGQLRRERAERALGR